MDIGEDGFFNFTMIDSAWFGDSLTVDVSFIAAHYGELTVTLAFFGSGGFFTELDIHFDIPPGEVARESESETVTLSPGFYDVEFSSIYPATYTITLEQHGIDARDVGQRVFDTVKGPLFFTGLGVGGILILYVAVGGFSYTEPKIRRRELVESPEMHSPKTVICAGCGETVYLTPDADGVSICTVCGKRQIV